MTNATRTRPAPADLTDAARVIDRMAEYLAGWRLTGLVTAEVEADVLATAKTLPDLADYLREAAAEARERYVDKQLARREDELRDAFDAREDDNLRGWMEEVGL